MALSGVSKPIADSIFIPSSGPFAVRFNCAVGQLALTESQHIAAAGELVVLHSDNWFGSLGKTVNEFWTRVVAVPTPQFVEKVGGAIPVNTVCESFLKGESRDLWEKASVIAMQSHGVGLAELICTFKAEARKGEKGSYFAFGFEFRQASKDEAKFMESVMSFALSATESQVASIKAPGLICIDGMATEKLALLRAHAAPVSALAAENKVALPALAAA